MEIPVYYNVSSVFDQKNNTKQNATKQKQPS